MHYFYHSGKPSALQQFQCTKPTFLILSMEDSLDPEQNKVATCFLQMMLTSFHCLPKKSHCFQPQRNEMKKMRGKACAEKGSLWRVHFAIWRAHCLALWAHVLCNCPSIPRPQVFIIHRNHWRNEKNVIKFI